jgi:putative FmdB family regulatory protein
MPIYDYHCAGCGTDFELLVRSETTVACPGCADRKVERRMSLPARPAAGGKAAEGASPAPVSGGSGGCCGGGCRSHSH